MFGFNKKKKKDKINPALMWEEEMTNLYTDSGLALDLKTYPEELLTYGLSYLSEFLRVHREKDKLAGEIKLKFLILFGNLSQSEAENLSKRIERVTSSSDPLLFELIFLGVETYTLQVEGRGESLRTRGEQIKNLLKEKTI